MKVRSDKVEPPISDLLWFMMKPVAENNLSSEADDAGIARIRAASNLRFGYCLFFYQNSSKILFPDGSNGSVLKSKGSTRNKI